ncbi:MAG: YqgE/AlgH family protein [Bacteroidales bacterium]|nr:YqgE/AlgH family protein [Bacteroidales bacterium]
MEKINDHDLLSIDQNWFRPMSGRILISEPFSGAEYFEKAVVYLADYGKQGTVGFILNKPILLNVNPLLSGLAQYPWNLWYGGPVGNDSIYFIHTAGPNIIPGSVPIADGIFWGGDFDLVIKKMESGELSEKSIRFFLGYSGWEEGQLEKEIEKKFWLVGNLDPAIIMNPDADIWKEAVKKMGGRYHVWENLPPDPSMN